MNPIYMLILGYLLGLASGTVVFGYCAFSKQGDGS